MRRLRGGNTKLRLLWPLGGAAGLGASHWGEAPWSVVLSSPDTTCSSLWSGEGVIAQPIAYCHKKCQLKKNMASKRQVRAVFKVIVSKCLRTRVRASLNACARACLFAHAISQ